MRLIVEKWILAELYAKKDDENEEEKEKLSQFQNQEENKVTQQRCEKYDSKVSCCC
jgi:hypothetical protein